MGAHEGSLLLWSLILAFWGVAVALFSRGIPDHMSALVLSVMRMDQLGFSLLCCLRVILLSVSCHLRLGTVQTSIHCFKTRD